MTNYAERPNHVHISTDCTFGASFGALYSVTAVNLTGADHHAHIDARFRYGLRIELTQADATRLERELHLALATLPIAPDCSGIAAELGGGDV
jgi:hypothetical protein